MKTSDHFERWFVGVYGEDPRGRPLFDEPGLREQWSLGLYAQRRLKNGEPHDIIARQEMEHQIQHGQDARTALDAADRWRLIHDASREAWDEAIKYLSNRRKPCAR